MRHSLSLYICPKRSFTFLIQLLRHFYRNVHLLRVKNRAIRFLVFCTRRNIKPQPQHSPCVCVCPLRCPDTMRCLPFVYSANSINTSSKEISIQNSTECYRRHTQFLSITSVQLIRILTH